MQNNSRWSIYCNILYLSFRPEKIILSSCKKSSCIGKFFPYIYKDNIREASKLPLFFNSQLRTEESHLNFYLDQTQQEIYRQLYYIAEKVAKNEMILFIIKSREFNYQNILQEVLLKYLKRITFKMTETLSNDFIADLCAVS